MKTQKTQQMQKTQNKHKQGFTLLELLVVTIIIGILAAIALPQYQLVVGKSKYTTLKNITRSIGDAVERSYLANNAYPKNWQELDIEQPVGLDCWWWSDGQDIAACYKDVANKQMGYYWNFRKHKNHMCYTTSTKENHVTNKVCQRETGKANGWCSSGSYCTYGY